ncbi:MAG: hypothetical protein AB7U83_05385 [Vicinamibacterales bacterium]
MIAWRGRLLQAVLAAAVAGLVVRQAVSPGQWRAGGILPPSELPDHPGYRVVWAESPDAAPRPGDLVVEQVHNDPTPFAPHHERPLLQAGFLAQRAAAAVVLTLATDSGAGRFVSTASALVEEVPFNRSGRELAPGTMLHVDTGGFGGSRTRVVERGAGQIVARSVFARVPRAGGRYLLFLNTSRDGLLLAQFGYGNAFEFRGRRLVTMSVPDRGTWRESSDATRTLALVRHVGSQPALAPNVWAPLTGLAP